MYMYYVLTEIHVHVIIISRTCTCSLLNKINITMTLGVQPQ